MHRLDRLFKAKSIAVVGASTDPAKLGYATLSTLLQSGYEGKVYPVNPKAELILGLRAFSSLTEVPDSPDLVVIVVPATTVAGVIREAVAKQVGAVLVHTGGFREAGRPDLELELEAICQKAGLALLGPNIQGMSYLPNKLCAMFWPNMTVPGPLGIVSQSGTVTGALAEWAADDGLGISAAVNLGNQVDLCESDIVDYLLDDDPTRAIALYLEGVKHGRRFLETVRRAAGRKPLVVMKSGRTPGGQAATASHTGSLAANDAVFSAVCHQYGIVRADNLEALYDSSKALATLEMPPSMPTSNRILVISTSGGSGAIAIDEAENQGLAIPRLSSEYVAQLRKLDIPPWGSFSNPLDLASLSPLAFLDAVLLAESHDIADIYLLIFGDPVPGAAEAVRDMVAKVGRKVAVAYYGGGSVAKEESGQMQRFGIPVFPTPERAITAIGALASVARFRRPNGEL